MDLESLADNMPKIRVSMDLESLADKIPKKKTLSIRLYISAKC